MKMILKPGHNCQGIFDVHETGLIVDGCDYYRAFFNAARKARRYILIAGWQFDSDVPLLRGKDAQEAGTDVRLLPFLNKLCEDNPDLEIYMLAWDFSVIFALDREWFQQVIFNWTTNKRLRFRFDSGHAIGASHHQKFVVIDGQFAFVGGLDICSNRWDDRRHLSKNPYRKNPEGKPYEPYHDLQSYHIGPAALQLAELFQLRWLHSGGGELSLPSVQEDFRMQIENVLPITHDRVAISRTQGKSVVPLLDSIQEIRHLYLDAINEAEKLIYIENQFFSSQAVYKALSDRMKDKSRSKLQIIVILPRKPHALIEELTMGIVQAKMFHSLKGIASREGHALGIYYTLSSSKDLKKDPTYIHAKLLLVDDRFLSIGSANTTNRSMGLDTELNVSWEATDLSDQETIASIQNIRISLIAEHLGLSEQKNRDISGRIDGLVEFLDRLAGQDTCQLCYHSAETIIGNAKEIKPHHFENFSIDPEKPIVEEGIFELMTKDTTGIFSKGINLLNKWLISKSK
jgi:phosphatidylserine/phosphatidylglycerophosphate/cardiolipin synthase-like enzyme